MVLSCDHQKLPNCDVKIAYMNKKNLFSLSMQSPSATESTVYFYIITRHNFIPLCLNKIFVIHLFCIQIYKNYFIIKMYCYILKHKQETLCEGVWCIYQLSHLVSSKKDMT